MTLKSFNFDENTLSKITAIKKSKGFKSEKEVLVQAVESYILSQMIEHESVEYRTLKKINEIHEDLKRLNNKVNHIDHGVSINNLFLTSDFEVNQHPKAIVNRDTFNSEYYQSAKKEVTKLIREKDSEKRTQDTLSEITQKEKTQAAQTNSLEDDDWLNV